MIEQLKPETREELVSLMHEFYHSPAVLAPVPDAYFERTCDEILAGSPFAAAHLIRKNGKLAGYALLAFTYSNEAGGLVVWIEELYVRPEFQGQGLGSRYFAWLQEAYGDRVARMRLEVEPENERARALYSRMGYEDLPYMQMRKELQ